MRAAAFLDRDGTLNTRPPAHTWLTDPAKFAWLPGAVAGAAALARQGYVLVVVSNQRGLSTGEVTTSILDGIEELMQADLGRAGCSIARFAYCPHSDADRCACRKPAPGLLLESAAALNLDLARSWMIGDAASDVAAGIAAGCQTMRIGCDARSLVEAAAHVIAADNSSQPAANSAANA